MSANNDYKITSRVYSGDDLRSTARASRMEGLQNLSRSQSDGNPYSRSSGILRRVGPGWVSQRPAQRLFIGRGGGGVKPFPWRIRTFQDPDTGAWIATVDPGSISGLLPVNLLENLPINDALDFKWYIKINCQTNGLNPTVVTLFPDTSPIDASSATTQNTPPPAFEVVIGMIMNTNVYQVISDNLIASPDIAFIESITPPGSGQEPFLRWWNWKVTTQ